MSKYNFSYSSIDDVYAVSQEERAAGNYDESRLLAMLAQDLERQGIGEYGGETYYLSISKYGQEIISDTDLQLLSEQERYERQLD